MQHILVTGGNGFIGSYLVDKLASLECQVTVLDLFPRPYDDVPQGVDYFQGDLQDLRTIQKIIEDQQIEVVYHIAWAKIQEKGLKDPVNEVQINLIPSINLLNCCREAGVKRVIFMSSGGAVYGLRQKLPIKESNPTNPINAYGISKLMVEKYLQMFYHLYGLEYVILRPSNPYGPRQNPFRHQGVVTVFIYKALMGEPVTIFGDGEIYSDYFHIADLTRGLVASKDVEFDPLNTIFNLGGIKPYTLNELVKKIELVLGLKIEVVYDKMRIFDVPQIHLDSSLAKSRLNWEPTIPLEEGIQHTAKWLRGLDTQS
jgi:UDP-glucose 4-epimerase